MSFIPTDPLYPFFSIFSFFSFFLPLVPCTWHLQAWNSGACFYMIWASLLGLINFVNSIVWAGQVLDVAPIWCDFSTHAFVAGTYATPLCSLCIIRRLYLIASSKLVMTRIERRRALIFDTVLSFIIPLVLSGSQYIVEGRRYVIYEEIGCWPHVYNTIPGLLFVNLPSILTGLVSAIYGILCLHAIFRHLQELEEFYTLVSASTFTSDRFIPIVVLIVLEIMCTIPLSIFALTENIKLGPQPWISWDFVHADFNVIDGFPSVIWKSNDGMRIALETSRWITSSFGIIIFLILGTTYEARRHYSKGFKRLARVFGHDTSPTADKDSGENDVPDNSLTETNLSLPIIDIRRMSQSTISQDNCASKSVITRLEDLPVLDITSDNNVWDRPPLTLAPSPSERKASN